MLAPGCGQAVEEVVEETQEAREQRILTQAANRLEAVQELERIVIGISADYAPFAFETDPSEEGALPYAGADIELGKYIAQELGVEPEFREMEFEECLEAAGNGEVDMVLLGMLPKQERKKQVDFTDVYYKPGKQMLVVKKNQKEKLASLNAFAGKTVAAQYGTLQAQLVIEQLPESYMELADSVSGTVLMLRLGQADAAVLDEELAEEAVKEYTELAVSGAELAYTPEGIVGGVVKGEEELLAEVNKIIEKVTEEKLYLNWLDEAYGLAESLQEATPAVSLQGPDSASQAAGNGQ